MGIKIKNTLYGDHGYIINNKWIPEEALEAQAVPFNDKTDILTYAIREIKQLQKLLKGCKNQKKAILILEANKLIKILKQDEQRTTAK